MPAAGQDRPVVARCPGHWNLREMPSARPIALRRCAARMRRIDGAGISAEVLENPLRGLVPPCSVRLVEVDNHRRVRPLLHALGSGLRSKASPNLPVSKLMAPRELGAVTDRGNCPRLAVPDWLSLHAERFDFQVIGERPPFPTLHVVTQAQQERRPLG